MNIAELRQPDQNGRVILRVEGRLLMLPRGVAVADMNSRLQFLVGSLTPACSFGHTIHFNPSVTAILSMITVVHESVHTPYQEERMGVWGYRATYEWQFLLSFCRSIDSRLMRRPVVVHVHDNHLMEQEPRWIALAVVADIGGYPVDAIIDVAAEIERVTGWAR